MDLGTRSGTSKTATASAGRAQAARSTASSGASSPSRLMRAAQPAQRPSVNARRRPLQTATP